MEFLCGICWELASTRLGIGTKQFINFLIILLSIFLSKNKYCFMMHLINFQVASKDIDDFMNQFLRKKKYFPSHTMYIAPHLHMTKDF
jgi:hypothetical protein